MGHAVWKLTSLVGISGLGFLILLQAQQGIQQSQAEAETSAQSAEAPDGDVRDAVRLASESSMEVATHSLAQLGQPQAHVLPADVDGREGELLSTSTDEIGEAVDPASPVAWRPEPIENHPLANDDPAAAKPISADGMMPIAQRDPSAADSADAAVKPPLFPEDTSHPAVAPASFEAEPTPAPSVPDSPETNIPTETPATIAREERLAPFRRQTVPEKDVIKAEPSENVTEAAMMPATEAEVAAETASAPQTETPDAASNPFGGFGPPPGLMGSAPEATAPTETNEPQPSLDPARLSGESDPTGPVPLEETEPVDEIPPASLSQENAPKQPTTGGTTTNPAPDSPLGSSSPASGTGTVVSGPFDPFGEDIPSAGEDSLEPVPESASPLQPLPEAETDQAAMPEAAGSTSAPTATDFAPNSPGGKESDPPTSPAAGDNESLFDPGIFQPELGVDPKPEKPIQPKLESAADKIDPFAAVMEQDSIANEPSPATFPFGGTPPTAENLPTPNTDGHAPNAPADENGENTNSGSKPFVIDDNLFATEDDPLASTPEPFAAESESPEPLPETEAPEEKPAAPEVNSESENSDFDFGTPPAFSFDEIEGTETRPEPLAPAGDDAAPFPVPAGNTKPAAGTPLVDVPAVPPSEPELAGHANDTFGPPDDESVGELGESSDNRADSTDESIGNVPEGSPAAPQRRDAKLAIVKTAPTRAVIGEPVVYEIVVTNKGHRPAQDVTVSDVVPDGAQLKGTIPRAKMKDDRLTWALGTLVPDASATIRIQVVPRQSGSLGSVATVTFEADVPGRTDVVAPKLQLKMNAPNQVALGQPVDFQFEIANAGSATATNVILRDILPAGFQHADGQDLEYDVGTLAPGAVETVTLRVATVKAGVFSNRAILTGEGGLKSEERVTVKVMGQPLSLIRQGPRRRLVGHPAKYTNIVRNTSPEPVDGAKVIEIIPAGMTFVRATQGGQFNPQARSVAWRVGPLAPGEETTVAVTLTATSEGTQKSRVRIENVEGGPVEVATTTTVDSIASLTPTIQGLDKTILVGQRAAFRILLQNAGTAPARDVLVSLVLPPRLRFIEARGGKAFPGPDGVTTVRADGLIPAGDEHEIEFVVEAVAPGPARLRTSIQAAQLGNPLVRDTELRVVAARS